MTVSLFVKHNDLKCEEMQTFLRHSTEHTLLPARWGHSPGVSCPALHMHTHTDKHTHSDALQGTTALTAVGEAR